MKVLILAALCLGLALPAVAADTLGGPPVFAATTRIGATMKASPVAGSVSLGKQPIIFEHTLLSLLATRAGAEIGHRGEGSNQLDWLCFTDEASQTRLWITSDYAAYGAINGLTLVRLPKVQPTEHCPALPDGWKRIKLPRDVQLGMSGDALKAKVGAPSYDQKGLMGFFYATPTIVARGNGHRAASLWAAVDKGQVGALGLGQVTLTD